MHAGHLMEKIEKENLLHRAFSVFLFNSNYELLLQVRGFSDSGFVEIAVMEALAFSCIIHYDFIFN